MKGVIITAAILATISILPVCRGAGHSRHDGVNFWKLLHDSTNISPDSPFGHPHIPYDMAMRRARAAYQEMFNEQS